jgi:hypothetical protein
MMPRNLSHNWSTNGENVSILAAVGPAIVDFFQKFKG